MTPVEVLESGYAVVVQRTPGDGLVLMSAAVYWADHNKGGEFQPAGPMFALCENGVRLRNNGQDDGSRLGAEGRAEFRRMAAGARFVTYSGDVPTPPCQVVCCGQPVGLEGPGPWLFEHQGECEKCGRRYGMHEPEPDAEAATDEEDEEEPSPSAGPARGA